MSRSAPSQFQVEATTGSLCLQAELDYEMTSSYQFLVEAVDTDGLSTQAVVQVQVTDVNDNQPRFQPRDYWVNLLAGARPDSLVTVQARDPDTGLDGSLTYSITLGNDRGYFRIEPDTGTIYLHKKMPVAEGVFHLKVKATDGGGLTSPDLAEVVISVIKSVVDPPVFASPVYNFTISEDAGLNQLVGQVHAETSSPEVVSYCLLHQTTTDWFRLDERTGQIFTQSPLDRELVAFLVLSVQSQSGFPPVFAIAQVNITIADVNDNRPQFLASSLLELDVWEHEHYDDVIYVSRALDADSGNNGSVRYRLWEQLDGPFTIHALTGEISLTTDLDYENQQEYVLLVLAEDLGTPFSLSSNLTLTVKVKDINDNAPSFEQDVFEFQVPENVEIGHPFGQVLASDADSGPNGRVTFNFAHNFHGSLFGISSMDGTIWAKTSLDREFQEVYEIPVEAVDHGSTVQLSASAVVRIILVDVNDNPPKFSRTEFTFALSESTEPDCHVGRAQASDPDSGLHGQVSYFLSNLRDIFAIDPRTGDIRTKMWLDREQVSRYDLLVYACDSGMNPHTATATVKLLVLDENDNRPSFLESSPLHVNIPENKPKGTRVVKLTAVDEDEGEEGRITYFFHPEDSQRPALTRFHIHPRTGQVTTTDVLDHEAQSTFLLTVVARDGGQKPHQTSLNLTISVLDYSDQAMLHHSYFLSLRCVENSPVGTVVGRVSLPWGRVDKLSYTLVGGNVFSLFSVDYNTGEITTVGVIDYEKVTSHSLSIQAADTETTTTQPRSWIVGVTIEVLDVNDNAPVFEDDLLIVTSLSEDAPIGQVIHKFLATDPDTGVNGTVHYSIISCFGVEEAPCPYFAVNQTTGELYLSHNVDHELLDKIVVTVKAQDTCPVQELIKHSLAVAVVHLTDVNDNAPEFHSPDQLLVREDVAVGTIILLLVAEDRDSNKLQSGNNLVNYQIMSGNEDKHFQLEPDTGYLRVSDRLDYETQDRYTLNITAQDLGTPPLASYQLLMISVMDVNDNPPIFDQPVYWAEISENNIPPTPVIRVTATDTDTGDSGQLTYFLPGYEVDETFKVDAHTGVLSAMVSLDREVKSSYTLTVFVKDGSYPFHYQSSTVIIRVTDQNDNAPQFSKQQYFITVPENRALQSMLKLVAVDLDVDENAELTYSITGGNNGNFQMDPQLGILTSKPLDREVMSEYVLTISASDHGNSQQSGTTIVFVSVLDENDNGPVFDQMLYSASVAENLTVGEVVLTVTARDRDAGQNGQVTYYLVSDTEGYFLVDSSTGQIRTSRRLDREVSSVHSFQILASDAGVPTPRNFSTRVIITVSDINDNFPVFSVVPYTVQLDLFTPSGTLLLMVEASDLDLGRYGEVEYALLADGASQELAENLYLDKVTGEIYTSSALFMEPGHWQLLVVASDLSPPSTRLSSTGIIEILVGAWNRTTFKFSMPEYWVNLTEEPDPGTQVVRVSAALMSSQDRSSQSIIYEIVSGNERHTFDIDAVSGQITVADSYWLDFEVIQLVQLRVRAIDLDMDTDFDTSTDADTHDVSWVYVTIWINLTDANDHSPQFSQREYFSTVPENNHPETFVIQVYAWDADEGLNGQVTYSIIGGNQDLVFTIPQPGDGVIMTSRDAAPLDREANPTGYRLTVEARDAGSPSRSSTCLLVVSVSDDNDTPPFFPDFSTTLVSENCVVGCPMTVATASDVDLNSFLLYNFTSDGNPDHVFHMDHLTGHISLARPLDYEKISHYLVGVQVTDGKPDHTRTAWLDIKVTDENDNAPFFLQPSYETTLLEQRGQEQAVLTVMAIDADTGPNAQISYSLQTTSNENFFIQADTGAIYKNKSCLLASVVTVVVLVVRATDQGLVPQSSTATVLVNISPINRFPPRFLYSSYIIHVSEASPRGHQILQVSALDEDISNHGDDLNYYLVGQGSENFFIHPHQGTVQLLGGLDFETQPQFNLTVIARDWGVPARNTSALMLIIIDDANDNPPVFQEEKLLISLYENSDHLQELVVLNTSDNDTGHHAEVRYLILAGNHDRIFDNDQGVLRIKEGARLDYESQPCYQLVIMGVDCPACPASVTRLFNFLILNIQIKDMNEFQPRFPLKVYMEEVGENADISVAVCRVQANDADAGEMGHISYSIMKELDYKKFAISATTGEVTASVQFDYERDRASHMYHIMVVATDGDYFYDVTDLTIQVTDTDEFDPYFLEDEYVFDVPGSAKAGDIVGQVMAVDEDGGMAGQTVYSIVETNDYFRINPLTGNITIATTLHNPPQNPSQEASSPTRAFTLDKIDLTFRVSSGFPGSRQGFTVCTININRSCDQCQVPSVEADLTSDLSGGILAGIIAACIFIIVLTVFGIIFLAYKYRDTKKSIARYTAEETRHCQMPVQASNTRGMCADFIRLNLPLSDSQMVADDLDQSPNSVSSSDWGSEQQNLDKSIDLDKMGNDSHYAYIGVGNTSPDSIIHYVKRSQSNPVTYYYQNYYLSSLGRDSLATKNKTILANSNICSSSPKRELHFQNINVLVSQDDLCLPAEGEVEDIRHLETIHEIGTFKNRPHAFFNSSNNLKNFSSNPEDLCTCNRPRFKGCGLRDESGITISDNCSCNLEHVINWTPEYRPLAGVFTELAQFEEDYIPTTDPVYHAPAPAHIPIPRSAGYTLPPSHIPVEHSKNITPDSVRLHSTPQSDFPTCVDHPFMPNSAGHCSPAHILPHSYQVCRCGPHLAAAVPRSHQAPSDQAAVIDAQDFLTEGHEQYLLETYHLLPSHLLRPEQLQGASRASQYSLLPRTQSNPV